MISYSYEHAIMLILIGERITPMITTDNTSNSFDIKNATSGSDRIKSAYHTSRNVYDDVLTRSGFWSRLYMRFFWSNTDDNEIARNVLSYIPDDFYGTLLDVP